MHCTQKKNDNYNHLYHRTGPDSVGHGWKLGTRHCRNVQGRARQRKTGLGSVGRCRTVSDRAEQDRAEPIRVGQCRTALSKTLHGQHSAEPDRGGKGSVRQCRGMQDKVDPCWVGHDRIGRVGRDRAGSCKAGHGRAGSSSVGQVGSGQRQPGQGRAGQGRAGQGRYSTGQDREEPRRVAQCWTGLCKTWRDLAWSAEQDRGGKGRSRECRSSWVGHDIL